MTIDLEELYFAALERNCTIRLAYIEFLERKVYVFEIAEEDNCVVYMVRLYENN